VKVVFKFCAFGMSWNFLILQKVYEPLDVEKRIVRKSEVK